MNTIQHPLYERLKAIGETHRNTGALPGADFDEFHSLLRETIDPVSEQLRVTPFQAALYGDLLCLLSGEEITLPRLARHIGCDVGKVYQYFADIEALEERDLIGLSETRFGARAKTIIIGADTVKALCGGAIADGPAGAITADEFFVEAAKILDNRLSGRWSYKQAAYKTERLLENNARLGVVKTITSYHLAPRERFALLFFCHSIVFNGRDEITVSDIGRFLEAGSDSLEMKQGLRTGSGALRTLGLVDCFCESGLGKADSFCLTEKAREELLAEVTVMEGKPGEGMIAPGGIGEKALFYPGKTAARVDELTKILQAERFESIQKRLAEEGMRTGFACLFAGAPGTGKTETALQIARRTGRPIFKVDIANTKSMWFGESEKKIKEIFAKYRRTARRAPLTPILLINEADAVLGKRQTLGAARNGPGQTENAIQNIILEEIENLTGILIATTNLAGNLDSAFERRFLYKIDFERPGAEARERIWRARLKHLSPADAAALAARFDFSGGQIENIARKDTAYRVISGAPPTLEKLIEYCEDESPGGGGVIGFRTR